MYEMKRSQEKQTYGLSKRCVKSLWIAANVGIQLLIYLIGALIDKELVWQIVAVLRVIHGVWAFLALIDVI